MAPHSHRADSLLHQLWGGYILVNSAHHQAVDRLGGGLRRTAWSEGGVTEALEHTHLPVAAVQFHPERLDRPGEDTANGAALFRWLTARGGQLKGRFFSPPLRQTGHGPGSTNETI